MWQANPHLVCMVGVCGRIFAPVFKCAKIE